MNISVYHMLQSCGVQVGSYPNKKVKNETHIPGLKRVILTFNSWFHFPKIGLSSMIKSTYIFHLGNPNIQKNSTCWFYCQTVYYLRKKLSRDLGSPGSRQLLQLQLFSQIFEKFWTLLLILSCLDLFGFLNSLFSFFYKFGFS